MSRQEFEFKTVRELVSKLLECDLYSKGGATLKFDPRNNDMFRFIGSAGENEKLNILTWTDTSLFTTHPIPDKTPILAWDDNSPCWRHEGFCDAKNKCTFGPDGSRNGCSYSNYEILNPAPEWMIEAAKYLGN